MFGSVSNPCVGGKGGGRSQWGGGPNRGRDEHDERYIGRSTGEGVED